MYGRLSHLFLIEINIISFKRPLRRVFIQEVDDVTSSTKTKIESKESEVVPEQITSETNWIKTQEQRPAKKDTPENSVNVPKKGSNEQWVVKSSSVSNISEQNIPSAPKTAYQFETTWKKLRGCPEAQRLYLKV